jgi:signal peptidase I
MIPTYDDGQWTLMQRIRSLDKGWVPDRFDAIVVWDKNCKVKLCKRVIGLPGEKVEVVEGRIFIDDKLLSDSFGKGYMVVEHLIDPDTEETWWKKYENIPSTIIAPNHVWVVGDNREDSVFGHFPIKEICGKIVLY